MTNYIKNEVLLIELGERLKAAAEMVEKCQVLCDVGTDHALLPLYLIEKQKIQRAVASDIKAGPLAAARKNITQRGYQDRIELRLGDGLKVIKAGECDSAVIAGMGGYLIREIIKESYEVAASLKQLILQPMNRQEVLREYLYQHGFDIVNEKLVFENEKYYIIMSAVYTGMKKEPGDKIYYYIGEKLISNKDPLLPSYLEKQIKACERNINKIEAGGGSMTAREKQLWLKAGCESILNAIKESRQP